MLAQQIIKYIEAYQLHTIKSPDGYCYGLASMARDAFLLGPDEYQSYRNRLNAIRQNDFLNQLQAFILEEPLLASDRDVTIKPISETQLNQWPLLKAYAAIKKYETEINAYDLHKIYLEIRSFIETLTIKQSPGFHQDLFAVEGRVIQNNHQTVEPLTNSILAAEQGGTAQTNQFLFLYSRKKIIDFLRNTLNIPKKTKKPFALMLSNSDHALALFFEKSKNKWTLENHGSNYIYDNNETGLANLASQLANFLSNGKENFAVFTQVYSLGSDQEEVRQAFLPFREEEDLTNASTQQITELFFLACARNDVEIVTTVLKNPRYNINTKTSEGYLALNAAAANGHSNIVKLFLDNAHCNPYEKDHDGFTALFSAAENNHTNIVELFLDNERFKPEEKNRMLRFAFFVAISNGYNHLVKRLIDHYHFNPHIEILKDGTTALHYAAGSGHTSTVDTLITQYNCDANEKNRYGNAALHYAAANDHVNLVKYLLNNNLCNNANEENNTGNTAFYLAAYNGCTDTVKFFLSNNRGNPSEQDCYKAFLSAAQNGHMNTAKLLLDSGRFLATPNGYSNTVNISFEYDISLVNKENSDIDTALHLAIQTGEPNIVTAVLKNPTCKVNAKNSSGNTALHSSVLKGYTKIITVLINNAQCNPNEKNSDGDPALHLAILEGDISIVNALLQNPRCNPNEKDSNADTALHLAIQEGDISIVNALLQNPRCNPNEKDSQGNTALQLANRLKKEEIAEALRKSENTHLHQDQALQSPLQSEPAQELPPNPLPQRLESSSSANNNNGNNNGLHPNAINPGNEAIEWETITQEQLFEQRKREVARKEKEDKRRANRFHLETIQEDKENDLARHETTSLTRNEAIPTKKPNKLLRFTNKYILGRKISNKDKPIGWKDAPRLIVQGSLSLVSAPITVSALLCTELVSKMPPALGDPVQDRIEHNARLDNSLIVNLAGAAIDGAREKIGERLKEKRASKHFDNRRTPSDDEHDRAIKAISNQKQATQLAFVQTICNTPVSVKQSSEPASNRPVSVEQSSKFALNTPVTAKQPSEIATSALSCGNSHPSARAYSRTSSFSSVASSNWSQSTTDSGYQGSSFSRTSSRASLSSIASHCSTKSPLFSNKPSAVTHIPKVSAFVEPRIRILT